MNFKEDAEYRKRLALGFLKEAQLNFKYELWRSCVDNSQLAIENSGKLVIALFEPVEKTHNPSHQLKRILDKKRLDQASIELRKSNGTLSILLHPPHPPLSPDYGGEDKGEGV